MILCLLEQACCVTLGLVKSYLIYVLLIFLWILCGCLKNQVLSKIWRVNLKTTYGPWAVVTGCTDGIGKAYAFELAKRGLNIILISRTLSKLEDVSSEIKRKFKVETEIIQADFAKGMDTCKLMREKLQDRNIGILVNNVGVNLGDPISFPDVSKEDVSAFLTVNMAAPTYLTRIILPSMFKNKKGAIINISSLTAMNPSPFNGIYSASKAYNYYFSIALQEELKNKGIFVQTVTPGYVLTKLTKHIKLSTGFLFPTPDKYAADAVATIGYTTNTCGYFGHEILSTLFYILPQWITVKISKKLRDPTEFNSSKQKMNTE